jgi:hypothetical protein
VTTNVSIVATIERALAKYGKVRAFVTKTGQAYNPATGALTSNVTNTNVLSMLISDTSSIGNQLGIVVGDKALIFSAKYTPPPVGMTIDGMVVISVTAINAIANQPVMWVCQMRAVV